MTHEYMPMNEWYLNVLRVFINTFIMFGVGIFSRFDKVLALKSHFSRKKKSSVDQPFTGV